MKWKAFIFWTFVFIGLLSFFYSFNIYLYKRQEELQFFIPQWPYIKSILWIPGGCCTALGQFFVQYYQNSLWNTYMFSHPEDGCPTKYPFDSIYYETQKYLKKKKEDAKRNGTFFRR